MSFGGATKTYGVTLTPLRPDAFGMPQQSGEYFAPNPMLSSFGVDFALKFGGEDKKKGLHRKLLGYLITFTRSVLLFHRKKRLWWLVFGQKFAGPLVLVQKFTLDWEAQAVIWGGTAQKAPVYRRSQDFRLGEGLNQKWHAMTPSKIFERGTFCGTKIL